MSTTCGNPVGFSTADGELILNGVTMHCPAWDIVPVDSPGVRALWVPLGRRGTDVLIPGAPGVLSQPRRLTASLFTFNMVITGACDRLGAAFTNEKIGLETNIGYLDEHVTSPFVSGGADDGTIPARLVMPSGAVREGPVTIEDFTPGAGTRGVWAATLTLTVPAGKLVPTP